MGCHRATWKIYGSSNIRTVAYRSLLSHQKAILTQHWRFLVQGNMAEPLLHFITIVNPFNVEWRILRVVCTSSTIVRDSTVDFRHAASRNLSISLWCFRRSALWLWAWIVCHSSWAQRPTSFNKQRTFMIILLMILSPILWWILIYIYICIHISGQITIIIPKPDCFGYLGWTSRY